MSDGPDLPRPSYGHCAIRRKSTEVIYFLGGVGYVTLIYSIDADTRTFELLPPQLNQGRVVPNCVILDDEGLMVIAQGVTTGWSPTDTVEILDLVALTMNSAQATQRASGRIFLADEQMFMWNEDIFYEYDALNDRWYTVEDLPIDISSVPPVYVTVSADLAQLCQYA